MRVTGEEQSMTIRTFQPGDDIAQVSVYNEAAVDFPKFKSATIDEVRRRSRAADFDPSSRFYAVEGSQVVGYATFQNNGRVNFPWCRKGQEGHAPALFDRVLETMKARGLASAWAAYRADWPVARDFFLARGFQQTREVINYVLDLVEMPTPAARGNTQFTPLTAEDLPVLKEAAPALFRAPVAEMEQSLLRNSWFPPDSLFCLRSRSGDNRPAAVGNLVRNNSFADPHQLDASMPCFRLGAFGTEGMTAKRVNGLFSFVVLEPRDTSNLGIELLTHAARRMQEIDGETVAAQVFSDVPNLPRFYNQLFRRQGSFPVFERAL
jgi:hypothetical protein